MTFILFVTGRLNECAKKKLRHLALPVHVPVPVLVFTVFVQMG